MKTLIFTLLVIIMQLPVAALASEYDDQIKSTAAYKKLEAAESTGRVAAVNEVINSLNKSEFQTYEVISLWAKNAYLKPDRNPRYGLIYADTLSVIADAYKNSNKPAESKSMTDSGAIMFFSSQLAAREDVARCKDKTAGQAYIQNWASNTGKKYIQHVKSLNKDEKEALVKNILSVSNGRDLTAPDKHACASGMDAMAKAQKNGQCQKTGTQNYTCDASAYVELVSDDTWGNSRKELQQKLTAFLLGNE